MVDDFADFESRLDYALAVTGHSNKSFADVFGPTGQQLVNRWRARGRIGSKSIATLQAAIPDFPVLWVNDRVGPAPQKSNRVAEHSIPYGASQSARPDFQTMADAVTVLRHYLAVSGEPAERIADPVYLEIMYEAVLEFGGEVKPDNVFQITEWAAKRIRGGVDAREEVQGARRASVG